MGGHLRGVAQEDHLIAPSRRASWRPGRGRAEDHHAGAHRVGELHAHVPEPAEADDADLLAGPDASSA